MEINNIMNDNNLQLVGRSTIQQDSNPSDSFTNEAITVHFSQGDITLRFRVQCTSNYFGSDCNTHCVSTDRFTCDSNGDIVCREGYFSEATNCSSCVPATGCGKEVS